MDTGVSNKGLWIGLDRVHLPDWFLPVVIPRIPYSDENSISLVLYCLKNSSHNV